MKPDHVTYRGERSTEEGRVSLIVFGTDGRPLDPCPSQRLRIHSNGFEWGYLGSGPAQLALAILFDFTGDRDVALRWYQPFKEAFVCGWNNKAWTLFGSTVRRWLDEQEGMRQWIKEQEARDEAQSSTR